MFIRGYTGTSSVDSVYNAPGQRTDPQFSVGAVTEITDQWSFDALGRVTEVERFSTAAARWISQDPIGFEAGDANLHRYVENQVTSKVDHSGIE